MSHTLQADSLPSESLTSVLKKKKKKNSLILEKKNLVDPTDKFCARKVCEDKSRAWSDVATSHEVPGVT